MSDTRGADGRIQHWIQRELDDVGQPDRAVAEAIRLSSELPQRRQRRGLRAWLRELLQGEPDTTSGSEPEIVLVAEPQAAVGSYVPAVAASGGRGAPIALAALGVAAVAVLAGAFGLGWVGDQGRGTSQGPGDGEVRYGALALEGPVADGRDIVVAGDGSGHFWTIADAVREAVDGDRITVKPGTYRETIHLTKDISIDGDGEAGLVVVRPNQLVPADVPEGYSSIAEFSTAESDPFDPAALSDDWGYVFYIDDSDASISGVSILSGVVGAGVIIQGGAPQLRDLVVDPDGSQLGGDPYAPHEGVTIYGGSSATVQDSTVTGLVSVRDGSAATLRDNVIRGTCLIVADDGSDALIIGNRIESSGDTGRCPFFNVAVMKGAAPTIEGNTITGDQRTDGIRVLGPGTEPTILGNNVVGADTGIWIGADARGLVMRNNVSGARAGLKVIDASPQIETNGFYENELGISLEGVALASFADNEVCDNARNVELSGGATIPFEINPDICSDASTVPLVAS